MKKLLLFAALSLLFTASAYAQGTTPVNGGPTPGPVTPPTVPADVPVDGGVSLLLAGGAAYALRRLHRRA